MKIKFIETTNRDHGGINWGKFMVARFDTEFEYRSVVDGGKFITGRGWDHSHILVLDMQTGEGAMFRPGGLASADLDKHAIWVCPLFEPFLEWLYKQDLTDLDALPAQVSVDAPSAMHGYRRAPMNEFVNMVHSLIFSMAERGETGKDAWYGQDYLKIKEMLERNFGLNCDPEKAEGGVEAPQEISDNIIAALQEKGWA